MVPVISTTKQNPIRNTIGIAIQKITTETAYVSSVLFLVVLNLYTATSINAIGIETVVHETILSILWFGIRGIDVEHKAMAVIIPSKIGIFISINLRIINSSPNNA
jgi:hypothetical protein